MSPPATSTLRLIPWTEAPRAGFRAQAWTGKRPKLFEGDAKLQSNESVRVGERFTGESLRETARMTLQAFVREASRSKLTAIVQVLSPGSTSIGRPLIEST